MSRLKSQQLSRPIWPYQINHLSDQARDLAAWFPFGPNDPLGDMALAPTPSRTVTGLVIPQRVCDEWPGALYMAGDDDYVSYGTVSKFHVNNSAAGFAVSAWVVLRITSDYQGFVGKGDRPDALGILGYYALRYRSDTSKFDFMLRPAAGGNAVSCESTTVPAVNRLYHVVGVSSGATTYIYVNGRLETTAGVAASAGSTGVFMLGRYASDALYNAYCLDGWLMDVRLYSRALSAAEVYALYDPATRYDLYWMPWLPQPYAPSGAIHETASRILARSTFTARATVVRGAAARFLADSRAAAAPTVVRSAQARVVVPSRVAAYAGVVRGASVRVAGVATVSARLAAVRYLRARINAKSSVLAELSIAEPEYTSFFQALGGLYQQTLDRERVVIWGPDAVCRLYTVAPATGETLSSSLASGWNARRIPTIESGGVEEWRLEIDSRSVAWATFRKIAKVKISADGAFNAATTQTFKVAQAEKAPKAGRIYQLRLSPTGE